MQCTSNLNIHRSMNQKNLNSWKNQEQIHSSGLYSARKILEAALLKETLGDPMPRGVCFQGVS